MRGEYSIGVVSGGKDNKLGEARSMPTARLRHINVRPGQAYVVV
jgi:hypothetical protein